VDPIHSAVAKATDELARSAEPFLKRLFGPAVDEVGQTLKDRISVIRWKHLVRIAGDAQKMLNEAGLSASAVSLKIIHPLLDAASLEGDCALQRWWSALLANAASATFADSVQVAYIDVLRQLSSSDARFLDRLYDRVLEQFRRDRNDDFTVVVLSDSTELAPRKLLGTDNDLADIFADACGEKYRTDSYRDGSEAGNYNYFDEDRSSFRASIDNLARLRLLARERSTASPTRGVAVVQRNPEVASDLSMTSFGFRFVTACRPPKER
jgi:hypothetical protein